jgi:hypothetical protein
LAARSKAAAIRTDAGCEQALLGVERGAARRERPAARMAMACVFSVLRFLVPVRRATPRP